MFAGQIVMPEVLGNGIGNGQDPATTGKGMIYNDFGGGAAWAVNVDAVLTSELQTSGGVKYTGGGTSYGGGGAISSSAYLAEINTGGVEAYTLGDGSQGETLFIYMATDGGDATLTPSNLLGASTITFDDVGDSCHLMWSSSAGAWVIISSTATVA